jgi:hypothetical protein
MHKDGVGERRTRVSEASAHFGGKRARLDERGGRSMPQVVETDARGARCGGIPVAVRVERARERVRTLQATIGCWEHPIVVDPVFTDQESPLVLAPSVSPELCDESGSDINHT